MESYEFNSNPLVQRRLQREEVLKKLGVCGKTWEGKLDKSHLHSCRKIKGHYGRQHRCNCGSATKGRGKGLGDLP